MNDTMINVRGRGAQGDGTTLDTAALQACIDACAAAGGGTVYLPNGRYLTGTLYLKSNVELRLEVSAVLLGSTRVQDYDESVQKMRYDYHPNFDRCLLYAVDAENIALTGRGTLDGQASLFSTGPQDQRPVMIRFLRCRNVRLEGLRLRNPATWASSFLLCDRVFAQSLDIDSRKTPNGNGLVFDACSHVFVDNCRLDTSDDSICLQSSYKDVACRRVVVQNCTMSSHYAAMKIGMLSAGPIEDVTVSNCVLHDLECSGFKIQSAEGGAIRNLLFQNIVMRNVPRPVFLTLNHYRCGIDSPAVIPETGRVCNVKFDHMVIVNEMSEQPNPVSGFLITGVPGHEVTDVTLSNIDYTVRGGLPGPAPAPVPELGGERPEYYVFKPGLPSFGAYVRHARNVDLHGWRLRAVEPDGREALAFHEVAGLQTYGIAVAD